jgi:predicted dehydrogenase
MPQDGPSFAAFLNIQGERGSMRVLNPLAPQMGHKLEIESGGAITSEILEGPSTFTAQLQAVVATLIGGAPFPLAADDPVKSMAAIDAVRAATTSRATNR